ncbi:hypothetical protein sS8_0091 [Methylocaldum marinum]|uniref:Uncharacterized protein n=1 Tax=Methylocaldum marinum TaxID=1432792 RepID=A0A286T7V5_9GAMM|nr:hypothetical protein [Methylocaldum marinum]BBA32060.1 hypothetical protein sS8_0091 [Methylocaldum marinum]
MEHARTVELLTKICVETPGLSDEQLVQALVAHGCEPGLAVEAVRFVPVAFARQFLNGMGISFSDTYWKFSPDGTIQEQGSLSNHILYSMAYDLSPSLMSKPVISNVAFRSPEANAVNNALNGGSQPANLKLAPLAFFLGEPTESGYAKAQERIKAYLSATPSASSTKPWWKIW